MRRRIIPPKYHYEDHDTDQVAETPPVLNQWYTVFNAADVRLLVCRIYQTNTETNNKAIEVRWTIDGNVYLTSATIQNATEYFIYRGYAGSAAGTSGLLNGTPYVNAAYYADKRGKQFKVEVRMTTALGTAQTMYCWCVRETLEVT